MDKIERAPRTTMAWLVMAAGWMSFVGWRTWQSWPTIPLDMSDADNSTRTAYAAALRSHVIGAAVIGAIGLLLAYGMSALIGRLMPGRVRATMVDGTWNGPARILLTRHAEKTGDLDDIHLSKSGEIRAQTLAAYIPKTFGVPDFIFAAARSKRSIRSIETMQPLAAAVGKPLRFDVEDKDFEDLVDQLASDPIYRGSLVVVCWHHGKLPEIAAALGSQPGTFPDPWPESTFNLILELDYRAGTPPKVTQITEPF